MTLSIIWMIMADHLRPWKQVQREFHVIEHEKLKAVEQAALEKRKGEVENKIKEIDTQIKQAEQGAAQRTADLRRLDQELKTLLARTEKLDTERRFKKAELDSLRSLYDGMIERGEEREARNYLNTTVATSEQQLLVLTRESRRLSRKTQTKAKRERETARLRRQPGQGTREIDARSGPGEAVDRPERCPVLWLARLAPRLARHRHGRPANQDPANQPARPDDQLQLQRRAPL